MKPSEIAATIDLASHDPAFLHVIHLIDSDKEYCPRVLNSLVGSPLQDDSHDEVSIKATAVAYIFRLLRWSTKGPGFDYAAALEAWQGYDAIDDESKAPEWTKSSNLDINIEDDSPFQYKRATEVPQDNPCFYLGYSYENWNRMWMALFYIRGLRDSPWEFFHQKRDSGRVHLDFKDATAARLSVDEEDAEVKDEEANRDAYIATFQDVMKHQEGQPQQSEADYLTNLIGSSPSKGIHRVDLQRTRQAVKAMLRGQLAYLRATDGQAEPLPVKSILSSWVKIEAQVRPLHGEPRNVHDEDFVPITHIASLASEAANLFVTTSEAAIEQLCMKSKHIGAQKGDSLTRILDEDLPEDSERKAAAQTLRQYFNQSMLVAGKMPPQVDYNAALDAFGLEGDARSTLEFNTANTRITQAQVDALVGARESDEAFHQPANFRESFRFLSHQVPGMYRYLSPYFN